MSTILRNANIVFPSKDIVLGDIGISEGRICQLSCNGMHLKGDNVIDLEGKYIFPGAIETHSHLGLARGDDDIRTETDAAVLGGVTTILFFLRQPSSYEDLYCHIHRVAGVHSRVDYSFHIVLITEEHLRNIPHYIEDFGVSSFKLYLTYRGDDVETGIYGGKVVKVPSIDDGYIFDAFRAISKYPKALAIVHAENVEIINRQKSKIISDGFDDMVHYAQSRPSYTEADGVRKTLFFARETGCAVNILHLTSKEALEAFLKIRQYCDKFYVEACQPYLMLSQKDVSSPLFKVRPPLRTECDRDALWQAIFDRAIYTIGSDHVPRRMSEKEGSVWKPAAGLPGTQYLFLNMLDEGCFRRGMSFPRLAELLSLQPAMLYGLHNKGDIRIGADADLVCVDLSASTVLNTDNFPSFSDYSIYNMKTIPAKITFTMVRGRIVAQDGKLTDIKGGQYIHRLGK